MSEAQTEQTAVTTTNAPAQPGATVDSARTDGGDELDTLLKEYETSNPTTPATTSTQPDTKAGTDTTNTPAADPGVAEVQRYIFRQDMDKTVKSIRGDLDSEMFDDATVKGWINARADDDPRLAQAWVNRHNNPKQFERVVAQLGKDFQKKFSKLPDRQATEDRDAVTAAVRGASTKVPQGQAPNYAKMSDAELAAEKDRLFGR